MTNYLILEDDFLCPYNGLPSLENLQGVYLLLSKEHQVVYVGRSKDMRRRINNHLKDSKKPFSHISVFIIESQLAMERMESAMINIHNPPLNIQKPAVNKTNDELWTYLSIIGREVSDLRYDIRYRNNKI